jgi:hypothetical protein
MTAEQADSRDAELLACPFCGCMDIRCEETITNFAVWCSGCGAKHVRDNPPNDHGMPVAKANWNRRQVTVAMYQARVKEVLDLTDENDKLRSATLPSPVDNPSKEELARIIDPEAFDCLKRTHVIPSDSEFGRMRRAKDKANAIQARLSANPPDPDSMNDKRAGKRDIPESPTLGSSIDLLVGLSFKYVETLDPARKHRYYRECGCCGGTDKDRDHYKPDIQKVTHKDSCPLARDLPILKAIGLASDARNAHSPPSPGERK